MQECMVADIRVVLFTPSSMLDVVVKTKLLDWSWNAKGSVRVVPLGPHRLTPRLALKLAAAIVCHTLKTAAKPQGDVMSPEYSNRAFPEQHTSRLSQGQLDGHWTAPRNFAEEA